MKVNTILFLCGVLFMTSCNEITKSKTEREGNPDVHNVESSDVRMNNAIGNANNTIDEFKKALQSENSDYEYFTLKQKFETSDGGGEHIWINDIKLVDSNYFGIIGNEPVDVKEISYGDSIKVTKTDISDWMYFDKGVVKGGYTIRALRDGMSSEERKQFDIESGLIFE